MQRKILPEADKYTKQNHRRRAWQKIVRVMACVVVFCTTYALILPAITMEKPTNCGLEEHVHSEECYEKVTSRPVTELACTYETLGIHQHDEKCRDEEGNLLCDEIDFIVHEHDESCVDESGALVCQLPEIKEHAHTEECWHTHTEACYTTQQGELICQTEESEDHQHTQDCYEQTQVFICELAPEAAEPALICREPEIQLHTHGADCYQLYIADDGTETTVLTCTKQEVLEHVHSEACFQTVQIPMEDVDTLTCGLDEAEAHAHTERCYGTWEMTCGYEVEHTHTLECHADKTADLETEETWTADLPQTLTGNWAEDLLAVAKTQVGYRESEKNYIVEADGETTSGYNRYGAWYASVSGDDSYAYAPWNVTFLFFDLYHAGINFTDFPYEETCPEWINALNSYGLYRAAGEYTPAEGDLVFVDTDGDGEADRVGVASEVEDNKLIAIEGDYEGAVAEVTYDLPELTVEPETTETSETTETTETEDGTEMDVSVSLSPVMLLSDGTDEGDEAPQPTVVGYGDMAQAQADAQPETSDVSLLWAVGDKLYLDLSEFKSWANDSAQFGLSYYDSNSTEHKTLLSPVEGYDYLYYIEIPSNMVLDTTWNFRFFRKKPDSDTWWNATDNIQLQTNGDNCYVITGWGTTSTGTNNGYWKKVTIEEETDPDVGEVTELPPVASGKRRVFYDATLSKLSYAGDSGSKGDYGIPKANSNVIYCWADKQYTMTKLTNYTKDGHTYTDVYYVDIPSNCTTVTFASFALTSATNYGWSGESTTQLTIPSSYAQPCFYANSSDDSIYNSYDGNRRGGYWDEAFMVRNPGIVGTVVDIPQETRENAADTLYLNTTFYDYYTDFELNGNNRDNYSTSASKTTHRIYQPFRHFNQALSSYYSGINASNPLYWGNFQNYTLPEFLSDVNVTSIIVDNDADTTTTDDQTEVTAQFVNKQIIIEWVDAEGNSKYQNGASIIITYTAVVTDKAKIDGEGNKNKVTVQWTVDGSDDPTDGKLEVEETIYTYAIALKKVNEKGEALSGATFQFPFYVQATADEDGAYIYAGTKAGEGLTNTITTPDSGEIVVKGVDAGEYEITETVAPAGYNKLTTPVVVTAVKTGETKTEKTFYIDAEGNVSETGSSTTTVTYKNDALSTAVVVVVNMTGSVLPSTGGMGTTIFYVAGAMLVLAAAVLLVTKRRMNVAE